MSVVLSIFLFLSMCCPRSLFLFRFVLALCVASIRFVLASLRFVCFFNRFTIGFVCYFCFSLFLSSLCFRPFGQFVVVVVGVFLRFILLRFAFFCFGRSFFVSHRRARFTSLVLIPRSVARTHARTTRHPTATIGPKPCRQPARRHGRCRRSCR